MLLEEVGAGPRVVLVHGSVAGARTTWWQQLSLAERFRLVLVTRGGYPPGPPLPHIDFEEQAEELAALLDPGDHLVGHSYGGLVALLAAVEARRALASLTLVEPTALAVARGLPAVEALISDLRGLHARGPHEPRAYFEFFLPLVGIEPRLPDPLPPALEGGARAAAVERPPWEGEVPLARVAAAGVPTLVVSGGHHGAFDAVCDVLERELAARREVLRGATHAVQRLGAPFNELLAEFVTAAEPSK